MLELSLSVQVAILAYGVLALVSLMVLGLIYLLRIFIVRRGKGG